jgi:hypothetical protein
MNDNENDFEALRRLLALKRHETPPPGYFDRFPGAVMARLRDSQSVAQDGVAERLPWLVRVIRTLEAKPAFATTFASALCLLLLAGIVFAERPEGTVQPLMQSAQDSSPLNMASAASAGLPAAPMALQKFISSTDPVFNPPPMGDMAAADLFGSPSGFAQPVSLILHGN